MLSISYLFLAAPTTVSAVVLDTCAVIWDMLRYEVFRPLSQELWEDVARGFGEKWQFPNGFGA